MFHLKGRRRAPEPRAEEPRIHWVLLGRGFAPHPWVLLWTGVMYTCRAVCACAQS